jgi:hypothetical protein
MRVIRLGPAERSGIGGGGTGGAVVRHALVLSAVLAVVPVARREDPWPALVVLWNLAGLVLVLAHPYASRWWDRRRGRHEEPTRFLTWPVCRKVLHHPDLPWRTLKRIDQAEAHRAIARLEARQASNVATVETWLHPARSRRRRPRR